jgi:hypothetical protein
LTSPSRAARRALLTSSRNSSEAEMQSEYTDHQKQVTKKCKMKGPETKSWELCSQYMLMEKVNTLSENKIIAVCGILAKQIKAKTLE